MHPAVAGGAKSRPAGATARLSPVREEDVVLVKELVEARRYRAVVDRTYPLEQVIEATKYVEAGQKTGNVVLTVNGGQP